MTEQISLSFFNNLLFKWTGLFEPKLINHRPAADRSSTQPVTPGHVYMIGAGPGDPELLTLKAHRILQQVDVVLYDWLVNPLILSYIPAKTQQIFVGKRAGQHSMTQQNISKLMVNLACQGKTVARLKGGDAAIFARTGEECASLSSFDIPITIVPGITSSSGAACYAGFSLTHRDCAQSVRFVTAHLNNRVQTESFPQLSHWQHNETLVVYMGLRALPRLCQHLLDLGMPQNMPVAVIDKATLPQQQVCIATLSTVAQQVAQRRFDGPSMIIIGEVVNKRIDPIQATQDIIKQGVIEPI